MVFCKLKKSMLFLTTALALSGCEYFRTRTPQDFMRNPFEPSAAEYEQMAREMNPAALRAPSSVVVCRSHQCAPAKLSMSKEYIYNSLLHLFDNNNYQKALVCQADPYSHTCLENYITIPLTAGITPTNAYIDHIRIADVIIGKRANKLNLLLNYNVTYGGQTPDCTPSKTILFAKSINHVLMEDAGYTCKMTAIGQSTVKTVFAIDYIDLDYGYIGGSYSVGISGPAYGGGNGYMLLRLPRNAYPLDPSLQAPAQIPQKKRSPQTRSSTAAVGSILGKNDDSLSAPNGVKIFPLSKPAETSTETPAPVKP